MKTNTTRENRARGFSLIELMVVIVLISLVMAAILTQVTQVQQRSTAEQGRVDDFQQARDFMAQIVRDGRQMGYPNVHNYDVTIGAWQSPLIYDSRIAAGLIQLTPTRFDFSGDVDGSGSVSIVSYALNGDGSCAQCMERAQIVKVNGDPLGQANAIAGYVQEVQNVQNGASVTAPIFSAFDASGNQIALGAGIDITTNPTLVAQVRTIKVNLDVANPNSLDPQTHQQLESDITGTVQIVNCSMASTQSVLQAAGVQFPGYVQLTCQ